MKVLASRNAVGAAAAVAGVLAGAGTASAATVAGGSAAPHQTAHDVATHAKTLQVERVRGKVVNASRASGPAKPVSPAPAKSAAPVAKSAAPAPPPQPYQVYDSVTPSHIPSGARIAAYATGGYAVNPASVPGRSHVTWIDTKGTDPHAAALDVEPGDATPAQAATWTWNKLHNAAGDIAIIYTYRAEWQATQAAISTLPQAMQHQVRYWIADPTGVPHIVPGAAATQWYWGHNFDISNALPGSGL